jgi:hypothetical protein
LNIFFNLPAANNYSVENQDKSTDSSNPSVLPCVILLGYVQDKLLCLLYPVSHFNSMSIEALSSFSLLFIFILSHICSFYNVMYPETHIIELVTPFGRITLFLKGQ